MKNSKQGWFMIAIMLTGVMAMASCTYRKAGTTVVPDEVLFSRDIMPILATSCSVNSSCHSGAQNAGDNINLDSAAAYNSILAKKLLNATQPTAGLLYVEVSNEIMPKAPYKLTAGEKALFLKWIEEGGKQN